MDRRSRGRPALRVTLSGKQFAALVAALLLGVVISPAAVHAAGSLMTIIDPSASTSGGTTAAKVVNNRLEVGDGKGALTVDGTVGSRPVIPTKPFVFDIDVPGSQGSVVFLVGPTTKSIDLTSLTISVDAGQVANLQLRSWFVSSSASACDANQPGPTLWHAQNLTGTVAVSFPTALMTTPPSGQGLCLAVVNFGSVHALANGTGFLS